MQFFFPYDKIRPVQEDMIKQIAESIEKNQSVIAHAPTGIGKTAAAFASVIDFAIKEKKVVFFLTSRHTQHKIAIQTLKEIKEKFDLNFIVTDIIGKKHMCLQKGVEGLYTNEFFEYCKQIKDEGKCEFYTNLYDNGKMKEQAKFCIDKIKSKAVQSSFEIINELSKHVKPCCPYEVSQILAKKALVIIADYYYIFNPSIRNRFLSKIGKTLEDSIVIVDEGHNVPGRIRELMTSTLSLKQIERGIKESFKYEFETNNLQELEKVFIQLINDTNEKERIVTKKEVKDKIEAFTNYNEFIEDLEHNAEIIIEDKNRSVLASIAHFLTKWDKSDEGFVRYVKKEEQLLKYRCLDPGIITRDIVNKAHSVIMMSGTLLPTSMYKDLIGFDNVKELEYESPFPKENRLSLIIPQTSTRYSQRSPDQFKKIADVCSSVINSIPGNVIVFFPSYFLQNQVGNFLATACNKTILKEDSRIASQERHEMIEKFKSYKKTGALLMAVASGSFGEGIDLPGDYLNGVVVVGIPLQVPDLETKELIKYYDQEFGKGMDYGYIFPAFNKILQNAGRCIRSKEDKGAMVFIDERYAWSTYLRCFPKDQHVKIQNNFKEEIVEFFW